MVSCELKRKVSCTLTLPYLDQVALFRCRQVVTVGRSGSQLNSIPRTVTALLYAVALNEYNMHLREDESMVVYLGRHQCPSS